MPVLLLLLSPPLSDFAQSKNPICPVGYELIISDPYLALEKPTSNAWLRHSEMPSRSEGMLNVSAWKLKTPPGRKIRKMCWKCCSEYNIFEGS
eukprot:CAMPEP_0197730284 /NCGR_PEP_ID=MMETSP1434-20131217/33923_1 /TAXON_ID=265543 /ORGANISM="Minutocellus polymorphus, Strain CCMP3303" /LENGTH=92 /DNA_ID=CAMNT_0043317081 /DNA_START=127 /DNA_END=402 /DNA_ORIENTATION=+